MNNICLRRGGKQKLTKIRGIKIVSRFIEWRSKRRKFIYKRCIIKNSSPNIHRRNNNTYIHIIMSFSTLHTMKKCKKTVVYLHRWYENEKQRKIKFSVSFPHFHFNSFITIKNHEQSTNIKIVKIPFLHSIKAL